MKPLGSSWPSTSLLGGMPYRSHTDLAETFRRIRAEQEAQRRLRDRAIEEADAWIAEQLREAQ